MGLIYTIGLPLSVLANVVLVGLWLFTRIQLKRAAWLATKYEEISCGYATAAQRRRAESDAEALAELLRESETLDREGRGS